MEFLKGFWEGYQKESWRNPEVILGGIPREGEILGEISIGIPNRIPEGIPVKVSEDGMLENIPGEIPGDVLEGIYDGIRVEIWQNLGCILEEMLKYSKAIQCRIPNKIL